MTTPYVTQPPTPLNVPVADDETLLPHTLPPPQTFDFLPPLHSILARLLVPSSNSSIPQAEGTTGIAADTDTVSTKGDGDKFLDIQHLGAASAGIKVRIQKARQAIRDLPDIERTIEEQEKEMMELEERIRGMKGVLLRVGHVRRTTENTTQGEEMET